MNELYETLGVAPDASPDEIKRAYRDKALKHHPDHGGSEDEFKLISLAGTVLTDPDKRKRYDQTGCAESDSPISGGQKILAELVTQALLQTDLPADPIRWMQEQVDCLRTKLRSMIAEHEHKVKQFTGRLEKFTKSNATSKNQASVRMITNMLNSAIVDEQRSATLAKENLAYAEEAMVMLNDLKYPSSPMATAYNRGWPGSSNWQVTRNNWGGWPS